MILAILIPINPSKAYASEASIVLFAGQGSTLGNHVFNFYQLGEYDDLELSPDSTTYLSVSSSPINAAVDELLRNALEHVEVPITQGNNAMSALLRLSTDGHAMQLQRVASYLAAHPPQVTSAKQHSDTSSLTVVLPQGFYLVTDSNGLPLLMSTKIQGKNLHQTILGETYIKSSTIDIRGEIIGESGDNAAYVTVGSTRTVAMSFALPHAAVVKRMRMSVRNTHGTLIAQSFSSLLHADESNEEEIASDFSVDPVINTARYDDNQCADTLCSGFVATLDHESLVTRTGQYLTVSFDTTVQQTPSISEIYVECFDWQDALISQGNAETRFHSVDFDVVTVCAESGAALEGASFMMYRHPSNTWLLWDSASQSWSERTDESTLGRAITNEDGKVSYRGLGTGTS